MEYGMNRTLRVEVRISPEEYEILDRVAKKNRVTVSDYLRWMAMWAAMKSGDRGALSFAAKRIKEDYQDKMNRFYAALGLSGIGKRHASTKETAE